MGESKTEKQIFNAAKALGFSIHKWIGANEKGLPDRIIIIPGRVASWFCVEVKDLGGKLSPAQIRKIKHLRSIGVSVYVCDCILDARVAFGVEMSKHEARENTLVK